MGRALTRFGSVLTVLKDLESAERMHRQAIEIFRREYGDEHPDTALSLSHLVLVIYKEKPREAEELGLEALSITLRLFGEEHPETAWIYYTLSYIAVEGGDNEKAIFWANKVLILRETGFPKEHLAVSSSLMVLGMSYLAQGEVGQAAAALEECLELRKRTLSKNHWLIATTNSIYGECLMRLNRKDEGKRLLIESYEFLENAFGTEHEHTRKAFERLERLL